MLHMRNNRHDDLHFRRASLGEDNYYFVFQEKDDYDEYEEDEFV